MNNVEYLERFGMLENIRYYLGVDEDDSSKDDKINKMSPLQLTRCLCGFELGDGAWADKIINFYIDSTHNKEK